MTARWAVALMLAFAACGSPANQPLAQAGASNSRTSSPASSPTMPALATVNFSCVLPVYGNNPSGFISFPAGTLTHASESGYYYDRAVARWVPVHREAVSPDGRRYAYTEGWSANPPTAPRLHVADAATRLDLRVATMPDTQPYQVVDFASAGVYLHISFEGTAPGVWLFDPATGGLTKVSDGFYPPAGAAWISVVDPSDPNPHVGTMTGTPDPNRIDRRDDAGRTTTWFYAPGYSVSWAAFAGSPTLLVSAFQQQDVTGPYQQAYWLVNGPKQATRLTFNSGRPGGLELGSAIADAHGLWIGDQNSLYLARRDGTILRVFDGSVYPANGCF